MGLGVERLNSPEPLKDSGEGLLRTPIWYLKPLLPISPMNFQVGHDSHGFPYYPPPPVPPTIKSVKAFGFRV